MIRVLLAEDQAMVRGALSALLNLESDIEVLGSGDLTARATPRHYAILRFPAAATACLQRLQ